MKGLTIRIDEELLDKLHVVADYGRSANGQVIILIRRCVEAYERKNGPISVRRDAREGR